MSRYRQTMTELLKQVRESKQKPYVSMSSGGQYNVLDKDGKTAYSTRDQRLAQDYLKKNYDNLKEVSDHEISMARGELEAIADKATQLAGALQGKSDEGNPLEAWVQSKITKAKDYINSVSDYLTYDPSMKQNEELEEAKIISDISGVSINVIKKEVMPFNVKVGRVGPGMDSDYEVEFTGSEPNLIKYAKKHLDFDGNNFSQLKKHLAMEETEVNEKTYGWTLVSKAKDLAKKFKDNMTKAVDEIEKLEKGLSKNPVVYKELLKYNEEVELDESRMKDIFTANQEGESAAEIAKRLKLDIKTVKSILGEETINEKVADSIIKDLQKAYAPLKGKTISPEMANKMSKHLDGQSFDVVTLRQLMKAQIPFISTLARNKIYKKTGKFEEITEATPGMKDDPSDKALSDKDTSKEKELKIKLDKEKDTDALEKQLVAAQGQINTLRTKLENEKNRAIKPEPNPETGEVPLTVGVAHKYIKDKQEKEMKKEQVDNYPTSDIAKHKKDVATDPKWAKRNLYI